MSNWFATRTHYSEVSTYDEAVKKLEKEEIDRKETEAREYNKKVKYDANIFTRFMKRVMRKKFICRYVKYRDVMGYVEIPKINVNLPIYQGTTEEVLSRELDN